MSKRPRGQDGTNDMDELGSQRAAKSGRGEEGRDVCEPEAAEDEQVSKLCLDMLSKVLLPLLAWNDQLSLSITSWAWRTRFFKSTRVLPPNITRKLPPVMWSSFSSVDTLILLSSSSSWSAFQVDSLLCYILRDRLTTLCINGLTNIVLPPLRNLTRLDVRNNIFTSDVLTKTLSSLNNLKKLKLIKIDVKQADDSKPVLQPVLAQLEELDIRDTAIPCHELKDAHQLRRLSLGASSEVNSDLKVALLPTSLQELRIEGSKDDFARGLCSLVNLTSLVVKFCGSFGCHDAAGIRALTRLESVNNTPTVEKIDNDAINTTVKVMDITSTSWKFEMSDLSPYTQIETLRIYTRDLVEIHCLTNLRQLTHLHLWLSYYSCYRLIDTALNALPCLKHFTMSEHLATLSDTASNTYHQRLLRDGYLIPRACSGLELRMQKHLSTSGSKERLVYEEFRYQFDAASQLPDPPSMLCHSLVQGLAEVGLNTIVELLKGSFCYTAKKRGIYFSLGTHYNSA